MTILMDAAAVSFLQQKATFLEPELYRKKYPEYNYAELVPVDTRAGEWAKSVTFYSADTVGRAEWYNGNSTNMPRADINLNQHTHTIKLAAIGYGYNLEELNTANASNMNLDTERAFAARRAYEQFMYSLTIVGDAASNMTGLINNASVTPVTAQNDGAGASTTFASKTGDQIARDLNGMLTGRFAASLGIEILDTIQLPVDQYMLLATKRMGTDGLGITVMEWLMKYNTYTARTGRPLTIRMLRQLDGAGAGSTDRAVAYTNDMDILKLHLPMPHKFLPVWQKDAMSFEIPGIFRTGGVEIRRPGAVAYLDGV